MKIRFLTGPNKGKFGHAERSQATQLQIDLGNIEEIAPSAQEAADALAASGSVCVPWAVEPRWGVCEKQGGWVVQKVHRDTTTWFWRPPSDCPASIVKEFERRKAEIPVSVRNEQQLESARIAQAKADAKAMNAPY